ncbi:MAG TPA: hypothetical protein VLH84_00055 [Patescibacteria group bacterium]|nr:hypothetical protein [Patescibacteria group bacterium]
MRFAKGFLGGIILSILLGVLWLLTKGTFHWLASRSQNTHTAIIGAAALLLVPVVTYFTTKSIERRRSVEQTMRLKKIELYQSFIEFFMRLLLNSGKPKPNSDEMVAFLAEVTPKIITYASNDVIKQWGHFRVNLDKLLKTGNPMDWMKPFEDILIAMRKDLGHSSLGIKDGDIARLFINDVDDYLSKRKQQPKKPKGS